MGNWVLNNCHITVLLMKSLGSNDLKVGWDVFSFPRSTFSLRKTMLSSLWPRAAAELMKSPDTYELSDPEPSLTHSLFSFCFPLCWPWKQFQLHMQMSPLLNIYWPATMCQRFSYAIFYLQLQIWSSSINDPIKNKYNKKGVRNFRESNMHQPYPKSMMRPS